MNIDIKKLISCGSDWEINRYTFLNTLKQWQTLLKKNQLYPVLDYSLNLNQKLQELLAENIQSKDWLDKEVNDTLVNKARKISYQLNKLIDFVRWASNMNNQILTECFALKEFVYENIQINCLGEFDKFKDKGYLIAPDNEKKLFKIYLYELTINWESEELKETLELNLLRSIPMKLLREGAEELIAKFVKYSQSIYDPMLFKVETDLDFAFNETLLPVIKEKLL
ncbi:MAG: hypothetical protein ACUVRG_04955, partial [Ignavibacterium sp.]|uniref:hypothetical protein n=1 Tax=Ignavibacterium sp. TaxID=2651167 RepID=UPI00404B8EE4